MTYFPSNPDPVLNNGNSTCDRHCHQHGGTKNRMALLLPAGGPHSRHSCYSAYGAIFGGAEQSGVDKDKTLLYLCGLWNRLQNAFIRCLLLRVLDEVLRVYIPLRSRRVGVTITS